MQTSSQGSTALSTRTRRSSLFSRALEPAFSLKGNAVSAIDIPTARSHPHPEPHRPFSHSAEGFLRTLLGDAATSRPLPRALGLDASVTVTPIPADTTSVSVEQDHSVVPNRHLRRTNSTDSLSTVSSSEAPATPRNHSPLLGHDQPTLVDLEHHSKFRSSSVCVACKKSGANFPSCPKCGETWCSRGCRLKGSDGTRHLCQERAVDVRSSCPIVV